MTTSHAEIERLTECFWTAPGVAEGKLGIIVRKEFLSTLLEENKQMRTEIDALEKRVNYQVGRINEEYQEAEKARAQLSLATRTERTRCAKIARNYSAASPDCGAIAQAIEGCDE